MKRLALIALGLLISAPAFAADNTVIVTPGVGVTMKSKDIGSGVQAMQPILSDSSGNALSTPTAGADAVSNTALGLLNYARLQIFNGTSWDRLVGDTTSGVWVNVKAMPTVAVTGTFFQATQPVSAAALPLPSGASTAAKQPALGTAGSASADVISVQGVASMTALKVDGSAVTQPVSGTVTTTPPSNASTNVAQINGVTPLMGAGNTGTGSPRVTQATDQAALATWGHGATAASVPAGATQAGCRGQNAEATAVTNGQLAGVACDLVGKTITLPYANSENYVSGTTAAMTGTTSTSLVASPGGSLRNYITEISCVNSHATVSTLVTVQDGSGGTALMTLSAGAAYGGHQKAMPTPLRQPTAATALFVANVTTGASVICSATGYKGL